MLEDHIDKKRINKESKLKSIRSLDIYNEKESENEVQAMKQIEKEIPKKLSKEEIAGLKKEAEEEIANLKNKTAEEMANLKKKTEEEMADLMRETEEEIAGLNKEAEEEEIANLKKKAEGEEIANLKKKAEEEEIANLKKKAEEEEMAILKKKTDEEMAILKKETDEEMAILKKETEEEIAGLKKAEEEEMANLKKKAEEEVACLKKKSEEEEIANLNEKVEEEEIADLKKKAEERDAFHDQLLRNKAEFSNYQKRLEKESEATAQLAVRDLILDLVSELDNFDRAMKLADNSKDISKFVEGIKLIESQLIKVLGKYGVKSIETIGKEFDPNIHEAVMEEENNELPHHTIISEFQRGFMLKERIVRPAKVKVSKRTAEEEKEEVGPKA